MYEFLRAQWLLGKLTEAQLAAAVARGRITQAQADEIAALPQLEQA